MTTYHLSIGYNACDDSREHFPRLLAAAESLRDRSEEIIAEVASVEPKWSKRIGKYVGSELLHDPDNNWLTVSADGDEKNVVLWASTNDGPKYAVRRAMVRMLMRQMHAEGIELCVTVA